MSDRLTMEEWVKLSTLEQYRLLEQGAPHPAAAEITDAQVADQDELFGVKHPEES